MKTEYTVTVIIPKDKTILERKYSTILSEIVADVLTIDELENLILSLEKKLNLV